MKIYAVVILSLMQLAAAVLDEELDAKFLKMSPTDFTDYFNELDYTWKMKNYPDFPLSILNSNITTQGLSSYDFAFSYWDPNEFPESELPKNFDARKEWCSCPTIRQIHNQFHCSSCWAHGVANTASDRICIHTGVRVDLSEQDLECAHDLHTICHSGYAFRGFEYWRDYGIVSRQCKPYEPKNLNRYGCFPLCKYDRNLKTYFDDKYKAEQIYRVPNDRYQIKAELYYRGPIQAIMQLYQDFQHNERGSGYTSGIYEHKYGEALGGHSVRLIGYGVENGVDYWLVANSWGKNWGENGFFRIKAFQKEIQFEESLITGIPFPKNTNFTNMPERCL